MSLQIEGERGTRRQTHWTPTLVLDFSGHTDTPPPSMTRMSVYSQQRAVWLSTKCAISLGKLTSDHSRFVPEHIFLPERCLIFISLSDHSQDVITHNWEVMHQDRVSYSGFKREIKPLSRRNLAGKTCDSSPSSPGTRTPCIPMRNMQRRRVLARLLFTEFCWMGKWSDKLMLLQP